MLYVIKLHIILNSYESWGLRLIELILFLHRENSDVLICVENNKIIININKIINKILFQSVVYTYQKDVTFSLLTISL